MFKEDYKAHYDKIHPSPELVERTKKMALEQYQSKLSRMNEEEWKEEESYETENLEYTEEKIIVLKLEKKKILQFTAGLAAGIALITVGYLFSGTLLRQEGETIGTIAENTTEPTSINAPSSIPSLTQEGNVKQGAKKGDKKKNQKENNSSKTQVSKETPNVLTTLAQMGNEDGVRLDYVSDKLVIFHGNFGILGYNLSSRQIIVRIPKKKYQFPDMWLGENVMVNEEGTKIAWSGAASGSMELDVYDIATGTYSKMDSIKWREENQVFSSTVSVLGMDADVYSSKATDMCVKLSEFRTCQLIYQAPSLSLQASLGIAIVDMTEKTEQIYDVFGAVGRQVAQSYGVSYGGYHNEHGERIFETKLDETQSPEETEEPEIEPTDSVAATDTPVEVTVTPTSEPTENITKPEPTEKENSQRTTQNIDNTES